jgi:hypothetical protein
MRAGIVVTVVVVEGGVVVDGRQPPRLSFLGGGSCELCGQRRRRVKMFFEEGIRTR